MTTGRPILRIGHELTDETRAYLKSGLMTLTLDQAPEIQARRWLDMIMKRLG
jgi:LacI family transcriptional regulator